MLSPLGPASDARVKLEVTIRTRGVSFERCRTAYFSEAFNQEVMPVTGLSAREVVESSTLPGEREYRRVRMVPKVHLPRPVLRLLEGHEIAYYEVTTYDPAAQTAELHIESEAGEVVQVAGVVSFTESGAEVVTRFRGEAKVAVFGVGRLIEKLIVSEVTKRYARVEQLLQEYLDAGRDLA